MTEMTEMTEPTKKPKGRPKGSFKQPGLSLDRRLKILSKIALGNNQEPRDVIAACKEITALLNDRVKETQEGIPETIISFEDKIQTKPLKAENKQEELVEKIEKKAEIIPVIKVEPKTESSIEVVDKQQVTKEDMTIEFTVGGETGDKIDE